ncbi:FadR/GntR family transcriptional regulator [Candidimonas nitroreducens]|uniref:GntR family transcriptional regulator n=1 Tax=Candidimonas nitroreducens TaxID=683354 RepID=A0A225MYM0_9BURK|nr:FadR/GntR family transcriptional regulator [Candidimonas nitroreducens]OWT66358.1 GntR family transcriptional regulator [Candidimonas nitroreducens]
MSNSSTRATPRVRKTKHIAFKPVDDGIRPADAIQAQIRGMISSRTLKAGDRLPSERDLAEQFSVSRNSVRQALRSLTDSGLLDVKKGASGGAFIRDGGGDAVRAGLGDLYSLGTIQPTHLTEARLLIGVEIVRLACERRTDEELEELEANVRAAKAAVQAGDVKRRTQVNLEFYQVLARMTHNPLLEIITDAVLAMTQRFVEEFMRTTDATVMPFRYKLLADLKAQDADAAAEKMREHLLRLQKIYLAEATARSRPRSRPARTSAPR